MPHFKKGPGCGVLFFMLSLLFYPLVNLSQPLLSLFSRERSSSISLSIDSSFLLVNPPLPCEWFKGGGGTLLSLTSLRIPPPPSPSPLSPFSFFFPFFTHFQKLDLPCTLCLHPLPPSSPTTSTNHMCILHVPSQVDLMRHSLEWQIFLPPPSPSLSPLFFFSFLSLFGSQIYHLPPTTTISPFFVPPHPPLTAHASYVTSGL